MIQVQINEEELKALYLQKLDERLEEIESEVFFMSSKELCRFVGMSWVSVSTHLLSDPDFPSIRNGVRWLFPKKEVAAYMAKYYEAVRDQGGDISTYRRNGK